MDKYVAIKEAVLKTLQSMPLRAEYSDEQRDLQPHVYETINSLLRAQCGSEFGCIASVGGPTPKPNLKMLGTSFWPDIEVFDGSFAVLGIELKLIKKDHRASARISETLGQALIYKLRYPYVIAMIVHYGYYDSRLVDKNSEIVSLLARHEIDLVLRRASVTGNQRPPDYGKT